MSALVDRTTVNMIIIISFLIIVVITIDVNHIYSDLDNKGHHHDDGGSENNLDANFEDMIS